MVKNIALSDKTAFRLDCLRKNKRSYSEVIDKLLDRAKIEEIDKERIDESFEEIKSLLTPELGGHIERVREIVHFLYKSKNEKGDVIVKQTKEMLGEIAELTKLIERISQQPPQAQNEVLQKEEKHEPIFNDYCYGKYGKNHEGLTLEELNKAKKEWVEEIKRTFPETYEKNKYFYDRITSS